MPAARDPRLAAVSSLLWPGLGQLYNGRAWKAALVLAVPPFLAAALFLKALSAPLRASHALAAFVTLGAVQLASIVDAVRDARRLGDAPRPWCSRWWVLAGVYVASVTAWSVWCLVAVTSSVQTFRIPTGAMEPTLLRGDHLFANNTAYGLRLPLFDQPLSGPRVPRRGDIIVFLYPEDPAYYFTMRLIGLPGETVEIRARQVLIDGKPLEEPYVQFLRPEPDARVDDWGPATIPASELFVLGDNRDNSKDSRYWGFVPMGHLRGQLTVVYYSLEPRGAVRWGRIGHEVR